MFCFSRKGEILSISKEGECEMKNVYVSDITLAAAAKGGRKAMSFREKLALAQNLRSAGVDSVELPACSGSKE